MTRALLAALAGDWTQSLRWHAMLLPTVILAVLALILYGCRNRCWKALLYVWMFLMMGYWLYRLVFVFGSQGWFGTPFFLRIFQ